MPIRIPEILLPREHIDLNLWSVIACDQFTQEPNYWQALDSLVKDAPSTLRLTLPEIYLGIDDCARTVQINQKMHSYLQSGVFAEPLSAMILVERTYFSGVKRYGLIAALDLEDYSFSPNEKPKIRATEGTIIERLPPRVKIREGAPMEFPHIMILIDDSLKTVIEPEVLQKDSLKVLYDFELNMKGGSVKGYQISSPSALIGRARRLLDTDTQVKKYGRNEGFLFAVGDGNHSLATAKMCWEKLKPTLSPSQQKDHPARFALCEIVNLYDSGLVFEPIHRFVFGIEPKDFLSGYKGGGNQKITVVTDGADSFLSSKSDFGAAIQDIDNYIGEYITKNGGSVDYIHGTRALRELTAANPNSIGLIMPKLNKSSLFKAVSDNGCLPRKAFSMGDAEEKRYYLEGKKIIKD